MSQAAEGSVIISLLGLEICFLFFSFMPRGAALPWDCEH